MALVVSAHETDMQALAKLIGNPFEHTHKPVPDPPHGVQIRYVNYTARALLEEGITEHTKPGMGSPFETLRGPTCGGGWNATERLRTIGYTELKMDAEAPYACGDCLQFCGKTGCEEFLLVDGAPARSGADPDLTETPFTGFEVDLSKAMKLTGLEVKELDQGLLTLTKMNESYCHEIKHGHHLKKGWDREAAITASDNKLKPQLGCNPKKYYSKTTICGTRDLEHYGVYPTKAENEWDWTSGPMWTGHKAMALFKRAFGFTSESTSPIRPVFKHVEMLAPHYHKPILPTKGRKALVQVDIDGQSKSARKRAVTEKPIMEEATIEAMRTSGSMTNAVPGTIKFDNKTSNAATSVTASTVALVWAIAMACLLF